MLPATNTVSDLSSSEDIDDKKKSGSGFRLRSLSSSRCDDSVSSSNLELLDMRFKWASRGEKIIGNNNEAKTEVTWTWSSLRHLLPPCTSSLCRSLSPVDSPVGWCACLRWQNVKRHCREEQSHSRSNINRPVWQGKGKNPTAITSSAHLLMPNPIPSLSACSLLFPSKPFSLASSFFLCCSRSL